MPHWTSYVFKQQHSSELGGAKVSGEIEQSKLEQSKTDNLIKQQ